MMLGQGVVITTCAPNSINVITIRAAGGHQQAELDITG